MFEITIEIKQEKMHFWKCTFGRQEKEMTRHISDVVVEGRGQAAGVLEQRHATGVLEGAEQQVGRVAEQVGGDDGHQAVGGAAQLARLAQAPLHRAPHRALHPEQLRQPRRPPHAPLQPPHQHAVAHRQHPHRRHHLEKQRN